MPWDGAFPIGRGRGGRGPLAGLPDARPLAASLAPRWAPAPRGGARCQAGGPGARAPPGWTSWEGAGGRACGCARARACHRVCERESVCVCVCVCARARAGAGVSLPAGARAARARACGRSVQRAAGVARSGERRGRAPHALQLHGGIRRCAAGPRVRGALTFPSPLHLPLPSQAILQPG